MASGSARAGVAARAQSALRADLATLLRRPSRAVVRMRGVDLHGVRGVQGVSAGTYRSRDGRWTFGALVVYFRDHGATRMTKVSLGGADSVAVTGLVDLAAPVTRPRIAGVHGRYGGPRSLGRRGQRLLRPALLVETRQRHGGTATRTLHVISLAPAGRPRLLARLVTRREHAALRHPGRGLRAPRYRGDAVVSVTFRHRGAIVEMLVARRRLLSRHSRCRVPKPRIVRYRLRGGRFRKQRSRTRPPRPCS